LSGKKNDIKDKLKNHLQHIFLDLRGLDDIKIKSFIRGIGKLSISRVRCFLFVV
jgi:hypothetical protein